MIADPAASWARFRSPLRHSGSGACLSALRKSRYTKERHPFSLACSTLARKKAALPMRSILQAAFTSAALFVLALSATAQSAAPPPAAAAASPAAAEPVPPAECTGELVTSQVDRFTGVASLTTHQDAKADYDGLVANLWAAS